MDYPTGIPTWGTYLEKEPKNSFIKVIDKSGKGCQLIKQ